MMVHSGQDASNLSSFTTAQRVSACWYRPYARIEPCDHSGSTIAITDGLTHSVSCNYCATAAEPHIFGSYGECDACHLVSLNDNADNSSVIEHWNGQTKPVVLTGRTLYKDCSWNTLCLPFTVSNFSGTPLADATVKTLESATFAGGTLTLNFTEDANNLTTIEAGKPHIVKWANQTPDYVENPVFNNVTISSTDPTDVTGAAANFHGIYSPYNTGGEDKTMLYMGADNKVYYPNAAMTIGAFRAYFQLLDGLIAGTPAGIRAFNLNFGDEASGVENVQCSTFNVQSESWFTLDGRKLSCKPTVKGIYINNGNKVVIK